MSELAIPLFTVPFSIPGVLFIIVTLIAWAAISGTLEEEKNLTLSASEELLTGLPPAITFSFASVYYLVPASWKVIFGTLPAYTFRGAFWDVMQMVGAIIFTVSSVA